MAEEYKAPEFSLRPILNPETKEYSLLHYNEVMEVCEGFIEENSIEKVSSVEDLKLLKQCRTNIRKKKDEIKAARIALTKLFSFQFKGLETALEQADVELKKKKEEFEASQVVVEEPKQIADEEVKEVTLVVKYKDVNIIEQLKKMAVENGCEVIEIKEKK